MLHGKLLAPRQGPAPANKLAPQVNLTETAVGNSSDLETRIDLAPPENTTQNSNSSDLGPLLSKNAVKASLQVQFTRKDPVTSFLHLRTALVFLAASDWDGAAVRAAIQFSAHPGLSTQSLGVAWQQQQEGQAQTFRFDGLFPLYLTTAGKYLVLSDDADSLKAVLSRLNTALKLSPAVYIAGFNHQLEHDNFAHWTSVIDQAAPHPAYEVSGNGREPAFFSRNLASLSKTLARVQSISIQQREAGGVVHQTVVYHWDR